MTALRKHRFVIALAASLFLFTGCSDTLFTPDPAKRYDSDRPSDAGSSRPVGSATSTLPPAGPVASVDRSPWENWRTGYDLVGGELRSAQLIAGDAAFETGDRAGALASYRSASGTTTPEERAAASYRVAAMLISLGRAPEAIQVLSSYCKGAGFAVDAVPPPFAYLFGFAYSRVDDLDQSFAWFSRVRVLTGDRGQLALGAEEEVRQLLMRVADIRLSALGDTWLADQFIRGLIGRERARRAAGGQILSQSRTDVIPAPAVAAGAFRIGALLPLTGKFAPLGANAKNGMELALLNPGAETRLTVSYEDSGDTADSAVAKVQQFVSAGGASVFLGPLISEQVPAVQDALRSYSVPMLSFSKRSDLILDAQAFRLGATAESQITSLLDAVQTHLSLTRFAIVAPRDAYGEEFSRVFRQIAQERGLSIERELSYLREDINAAVTIAPELEKLPVDAVFFPDSLAAAANIWGALPIEARRRMRPLGVGNWDNPAQLANLKNVLERAIFVSPFFTRSTRPVVSGFSSAYQERFRRAPDFIAAQAFDGATLALNALRKQVAEQRSFGEALRSIESYDGVTGIIRMGPDGELRRSFAVVELRSGVGRELGAIAAESSDEVAPVGTAAPIARSFSDSNDAVVAPRSDPAVVVVATPVAESAALAAAVAAQLPVAPGSSGDAARMVPPADGSVPLLGGATPESREPTLGDLKNEYQKIEKPDGRSKR